MIDECPRTRNSLPITVIVIALALLCLPGCFKFNLDLGGLGGADSSGGWQGILVDLGANMALAAEHGVIFYASDRLVRPGEEVELTARVLSVTKKSAIKNATVEFSLGGERLGMAQTDKDGVATVKWTPAAGREHHVTAKIVAAPEEELAEITQVTPAPLLVAVRDKATKLIVIDLDHTVVDSGFSRVLIDGAKPMAGAARVIEELTAAGYGVIYLTHRPNLMTTKNKKWLADNGLPRAPLLGSDVKDLLDSGKFKTGRIKQLRKHFPNTTIGVGDKFTDAEAYADNKMTAYLIPDYDRDGDDAGDFRKLAKKVRKLGRRVQVVDGWDEVRAGILSGRTFTPAAYAARLDARANAIRQTKKDKDDDDDD